ncbi:unnamed protein product [marine sediment metagenome]|uniref:Glycosyltransferase 2-like domain-containing protein n=1 Tax=marine sediment metagenome TaxID=412755 RepID=X1FRS2_9ZZZZ
MEKWPKVSIIILNWNSWQDTIECLESIKNVNYKNLEVIIIDNASYDTSPEKIIYWLRKKTRGILASMLTILEILEKLKFVPVSLQLN